MEIEAGKFPDQSLAKRVIGLAIGVRSAFGLSLMLNFNRVLLPTGIRRFVHKTSLFFSVSSVSSVVNLLPCFASPVRHLQCFSMNTKEPKS